MRRFALVFALAFAAFGGGVFADANSGNADANNGKFGVVSYTTLGDKNMDYWFKSPPNTAKIAYVSAVYAGEDFLYVPMAYNASKNDGDAFKIKCVITVSKCDNSAAKVVFDDYVSGVQQKAGCYIELPLSFTVQMEKSDIAGDYQITFSAQNYVSRETAQCVSKFTLKEWVRPDIKIESLADFYSGFNQNFSPENLYAAFFCKDLNFFLKGNWRGFNPFACSFFKFAFKKHKFLLEKLDEDFDKMHPDMRIKTLALFAICGAKAVEQNRLCRDEVFYQNYFRNECDFSFDAYSATLSVADIDLLWGEFFATGTYKPFRKILDFMQSEAQMDFARKVAKDASLIKSNADRENTVKGLMGIVAQNSVAKNLRNDLVARYLAYAMQFDADTRLQSSLKRRFTLNAAAAK